MHKNDFFSLYIFFISLVFTQLPRTPNHFPLPRHWTRDRDIGPATATLDPDRDCGPATRDPRPATRDPRPATRDPRPATRDPRLLVKLHRKDGSLSLQTTQTPLSGIPSSPTVASRSLPRSFSQLYTELTFLTSASECEASGVKTETS